MLEFRGIQSPKRRGVDRAMAGHPASPNSLDHVWRKPPDHLLERLLCFWCVVICALFLLGVVPSSLC